MTTLPAAEPHSELRTLRVLTGAIGMTALAATIASSLLIAQPDRLSVTNWSGVLTLVAAVPPLLAAAVAPWSGMRVLRLLNAVVAVLHTVMLVTLLVATTLDNAVGTEVPWFFTITAAPVAAALIAWGRAVAWALLGGITATIQLLRLLGGVDLQGAFANDVQAFFISATLVMLFSTLIRASRELDHSTAVSVAAEEQRSAATARSRIQDQLQVLIHDELLTTLVLAARDEPSLRPAVGAEAARVRLRIRELHGPKTTGMLPADRLIAGISEVTRQEAPDARLEISDTRADLESRVPAEVSEAVQGAIRQVLTNSRIHAGPQASSSVQVQLDDEQLLVVVRDDGIGFSPAAVPPMRMGIASSIIGRLRALPGGEASVDSTPGGGTTVTLRWARDPSRSEATTEEAQPAGILPPDDHRIRRGLIITIGVFLVAQAGLATLAGLRAGEPWVAVLALAGVGLGFLSIGWRSPRRPSLLRSWGVVVIAAFTAALSLVPVQRDPLRYGDTWYLAAVAFVLLALAIRGRPRIAAAGGAIASGLALAGITIQHNDGADVLAAATRLAVILSIGVCLVLVISRTQARAAAVRAEELEAARTSAYREAANCELRERSRALEDLIGNLLERLERGDALSPPERRECTALEGRLRDQYRGGRLVRPPLIEAAMSARRRGMDIVLLDDGPDRELTDAHLSTIASWMGEQLNAAVGGRFTGRILPADRDPVASVVTGDDVTPLSLTYSL